MKKLIFFLLALAIVSVACNKDKEDEEEGVTVSKTSMPRNVVLEEFTGVGCGCCPAGHTVAKGIHDANPGRVVLISIHVGSYASGPPDFRTQWGDAIKSLGNPGGYPNGMVNREIYTGTKLSMGRGSWAAAADVILNDANSPVNIGLKSTWNSSSRELTVEAELYYTSDATGPHLLNIAFLESGVVGHQSGGGENYVHKHILRDLLSGQWGTEVTTTSKESSFKKTYKYTVSGDYNIENCNIAAFVTQADHEKIFTGVEIKAKDGSTE